MGKMARNREREEDLCEQPGTLTGLCRTLCLPCDQQCTEHPTPHLTQGGPSSRDALPDLRSEVRLYSDSDAAETRVGCLFSFILPLYFLVQ